MATIKQATISIKITPILFQEFEVPKLKKIINILYIKTILSVI